VYTDASGKSWVCGEPGNEFYARVTLQNKTEDPEYYRISVAVDGNTVGYDAVMEAHKNIRPPAVFGIPKGDVKINAFKFVRHDLSSSSSSDDTMDARPGQGQVQLFVYKCDRLGKFEETPSIVPDQWTATSAPSNSDNKKDSSVLSAGKGNSSKLLAAMSKYEYSFGSFVETQTLNYTTEFGLAVRGMHTPPASSASEEKKEVKPETEEKEVKVKTDNKRKRDDDSNGGSLSAAIDLDED